MIVALNEVEDKGQVQEQCGVPSLLVLMMGK